MSGQATPIGREVVTRGARIAGIVTCVPARTVGNDHFEQRFGQAGVEDVIKMIGVKERHWVDDGTTSADLCLHAGKRLLEKLGWEASSVDALIFVTQTPDYRLPATACELQSRMGLPVASIAFDINLGCSGYPYALWLGTTMVQSGAARRVLLAVGETASRIVDPDDRATALLFGDGGSMTAVEVGEVDDAAHFVLGTDGAGASNLIIAQGGFRDIYSSSDKRFASLDPTCVYMDGGEIFNFTLRSIPTLLNATAAFAGCSVQSYDAVLFHQANQFMLKHLAKKAKLSSDQAPINIDRFGNTSSASIPLLMTTAIAERLKREPMSLCMLGFGVGYSWAAASVRTSPLAVVEHIEA